MPLNIVLALAHFQVGEKGPAEVRLMLESIEIFKESTAKAEAVNALGISRVLAGECFRLGFFVSTQEDALRKTCGDPATSMLEETVFLPMEVPRGLLGSITKGFATFEQAKQTELGSEVAKERIFSFEEFAGRCIGLGLERKTHAAEILMCDNLEFEP